MELLAKTMKRGLVSSPCKRGDVVDGFYGKPLTEASGPSQSGYDYFGCVIAAPLGAGRAVVVDFVRPRIVACGPNPDKVTQPDLKSWSIPPDRLAEIVAAAEGKPPTVTADGAPMVVVTMSGLEYKITKGRDGDWSVSRDGCHYGCVAPKGWLQGESGWAVRTWGEDGLSGSSGDFPTVEEAARHLIFRSELSSQANNNNTR